MLSAVVASGCSPFLVRFQKKKGGGGDAGKHKNAVDDAEAKKRDQRVSGALPTLALIVRSRLVCCHAPELLRPRCCVVAASVLCAYPRWEKRLLIVRR